MTQGVKRDWTGVVQGNLTIIKEVGKNRHGSYLWECRCACGATATKDNGMLNNGVKSCSPACGVAASNVARTTHGGAVRGGMSILYRTWVGMKQRCLNPNHKHYDSYGGRGITVHPAWVENFVGFRDYMGPRPKGKSLDRIHNDRGYIPGNVRWASRLEQAENRRDNTWVRIHGKLYTLSQVARAWDIPYTRVFDRYQRGDRGEALIAPKQKGGKRAWATKT